MHLLNRCRPQCFSWAGIVKALVRLIVSFCCSLPSANTVGPLMRCIVLLPVANVYCCLIGGGIDSCRFAAESIMNSQITDFIDICVIFQIRFRIGAYLCLQR